MRVSAYDALGRLTSVTDGNGSSTGYRYNELGQKVAQTDAAGHTTRFEYDARGRLNKRTMPNGQFETNGYDANSNLATHTDFNGVTTTYGYDAANRLLSKIASTGANTAEWVSFAYNGYGQRTDAQRGTTLNGTPTTLSWTKFDYEARGRLKTRSQTFPFQNGTVTRTLNYFYDGVGNLVGVGMPNGGVHGGVGYGYDADNRLTTLTHRDNKTTKFGYDGAGRRVTLVRGNGTCADADYNGFHLSVRWSGSSCLVSVRAGGLRDSRPGFQPVSRAFPDHGFSPVS